MKLAYARLPSPVGQLLLISDDAAMKEIRFENRSHSVDPDWTEGAALLREAARQIRAYFAGELREFDLQLAPDGTVFQQDVWRALHKIPYGATSSYAQIARQIGRPKAVRAVGAANGRNPLPVVIPCHRVIGSDGSLTGFGGGLEAKRILLELERNAGRADAKSEARWRSKPQRAPRQEALDYQPRGLP